MKDAIVSEEILEDFSLMAYVSSCFIEVEGKFLLLKRASGKPFPKTWCLPAGKQEEGEGARETLYREVHEETGISICSKSAKEIAKLYVRAEGWDYIFHMFAYPLEEKPKISLSEEEHTDYCWVTVEEALSKELIAGAKEAFDFYVQWKQEPKNL